MKKKKPTIMLPAVPVKKNDMDLDFTAPGQQLVVEPVSPVELVKVAEQVVLKRK
ncbi:hypothetical protein [Ureibacillus endophyticus]|uniref:hypothetical protein n=1 Tax=Ureibacillus endophyticus TaxID=1978490 RepID=UPI0014749981|nr:hypothetical protein [Lysinibacillus endophyticus]